MPARSARRTGYHLSAAAVAEPMIAAPKAFDPHDDVIRPVASADPEAKLVVVFGTAAPGEIRKYYREQVQDLVYGAMTR